MDYANSYSSGYGSGDYSYTPSKPKATTSVADKKGYTPVSSTAKATTASAKKYQTTYSSNDSYESPSSSSKGLGAPTTKPKTKVAAPTVQEKFASAYTSAGGTFNSYTARPDPISVYDSPDFKTVEDYLNKTAIEDALYDAQGVINQAYTPQMNMETRRMTEEEIKKFAPVKELTDKGVTVEELASMDAPMQKATLESLGITNAKWVSSQGMYPMSEGEFDKATMESVHKGEDTGVFDRIPYSSEEVKKAEGLMAKPEAATGLFTDTKSGSALKSAEGYYTEAYTLNYQPVLKGGKKHNSGLTIGAGFDLGQKTEKDLKKFGIPDTLVKKLKDSGWLGLNPENAVKNNDSYRRQGHAALQKKYEEQKANGTLLKLTPEEIDTLTKAEYNYHQDKLKSAYEKNGFGEWDDLSENAKAALTIERFHRGQLGENWKKFFNRAKADDIKGITQLYLYKERGPKVLSALGIK